MPKVGGSWGGIYLQAHRSRWSVGYGQPLTSELKLGLFVLSFFLVVSYQPFSDVSCRQLFLGRPLFLFRWEFHLRVGRKIKQRGGGKEDCEGGWGGREKKGAGVNGQRKQILIQILIPSFAIYDTSMVSDTDIIATYRYVCHIPHCTRLNTVCIINSLLWFFVVQQKNGLLSYLNVFMIPSPVTFLITPVQ